MYKKNRYFSYHIYLSFLLIFSNIIFSTFSFTSSIDKFVVSTIIASSATFKAPIGLCISL